MSVDTAAGGMLNYGLSRAGAVSPSQVAVEAVSIVNRLGRGIIDVDECVALVEGVIE